MTRRFERVLAVALVLAVATAAAAAAAPRSGPASPDTESVHIGSPEGGTQAFVSWPARRAKAPAVVVAHEWWGLNGQIREVARRLSRDGYVAVVPDLYHGRVATDAESAHELSRSLDQADAVGQLDAAVSWLRARPETATSKIGVMGFCMGGGLALEQGVGSPEVAAVVMFYGTPITDAERLRSLAAHVQAHFGADDKGIPAARVEAMRTALTEAGKTGEVFVYPGAGHAFMNEGRDSYRPDAARQAWARTLGFLQKQLKGS